MQGCCEMTDTRRRVKLYELNAERQWDDKGTGEFEAVTRQRQKNSFVCPSVRYDS